jgi:2,3-bisphosphoglycerate-dependent phosphoglycerate mutase
LRALTKDLEGISDEDFPGVEIPTGVPIVNKLDKKFKEKGKGRKLE